MRLDRKPDLDNANVGKWVKTEDYPKGWSFFILPFLLAKEEVMTNTANKTSLWENGLIWFGAALSIAEIQTGTFGRLTPQIATKPHGGLFFCTNKLFVYCIIK